MIFEIDSNAELSPQLQVRAAALAMKEGDTLVFPRTVDCGTYRMSVLKILDPLQNRHGGWNTSRAKGIIRVTRTH